MEHNPVVVKILLRRFLKAKNSRYIHWTLSMEERELLVSSPRKSVETQAHLSASNIDREASPSFTLSLFVAFLSLPLSTRFVPLYAPISIVSMCKRSFREQTSYMKDNASRKPCIIKSNSQNIFPNLYLWTFFFLKTKTYFNIYWN